MYLPCHFPGGPANLCQAIHSMKESMLNTLLLQLPALTSLTVFTAFTSLTGVTAFTSLTAVTALTRLTSVTILTCLYSNVPTLSLSWRCSNLCQAIHSIGEYVKHTVTTVTCPY